jgi:cell division protein FtsB
MRAMDYLKFIQRICLIASVVLVIGIVVRLFLPLIERQRELRARAAELRLDIQREAEALRMLRLKQARLQEDPRFIEKIAREKLGYAKPGETVFRFADEDEP